MAHLTPEALVYETASAADPQVSPDGTRLIFALARADRDADRGTSQIWLANIDGSDARRLTGSGDRNREGRWSPDGAFIAFVSDRVKDRGALCVLPVNGPGEARVITEHRGAIGHVAWAPDGASIAYTTTWDPEDPDEHGPPPNRATKPRVTRRLDYKQENRGWLNNTRTQVYVVDVASGDRQRLTRELNDHWYPQWSPDGTTLAARVTTDNGIFSKLALIDVASGKARSIGWTEGSVHVWSWSPDGQRILFAGETEPSAQGDFFLFDLPTDQIKRLTTDLPCLPEAGFPTILAPSQPVWLDDTTTLLHGVRGGESGHYVFNTETSELTLERGTRSLSAGFSTDAAHRYVVQSYASFNAMGEVIVYDRSANASRVVTTNNTALLQDAPPAQWEHLQIERDGVPVDGWLLKPADFDPRKKYPVVMEVHGGPHSYHGYGFNAIQQSLVGAGFVVIIANPRGSGSYGREFAHMVRSDWGGEDFLDLMAMVDHVLTQPYTDASRTGIWGYSYGGFMTAWTIGQTNRFKAAVCGAPCFDLESMYGTSDISHAWGTVQWGGKPHEASEAFAAHSPSTFAHRAKTPTLIMQGEADDRCPIGQGEQMFVALHQAGCEVEFARYPGGSHAMLRVAPPSHRHDFMTRLVAWFTDHLGAPA